MTSSTLTMAAAPDRLLRCSNCGRKFASFLINPHADYLERYLEKPLCKSCDQQAHQFHSQFVDACSTCVADRWVTKVRAIRIFAYALLSGRTVL
jgi:hypothetical protein